MDLIQKGSQTAKNGFKNEQNVCDKFNNWKFDYEAKQWLTIMKYNLDEIEYIKAIILHGYKADINIQIKNSTINTENIQIKLVSNQKGFNQVDKRWLTHYKEMWDIPDNIYKLLQYYTGEIKPYKQNVRDSRRMFMDEFTEYEQKLLLNWFSNNKTLILNDIIKGRGQYCAEWILIARKINNNTQWKLININEALQHYSLGDVKISPKGSIYIGRITIQRKGGDGGRDTANVLQFKLDPTQLFEM